MLNKSSTEGTEPRSHLHTSESILLTDVSDIFLDGKSFHISSEPSPDTGSSENPVDERQRFDGTIYVGTVLRILRGNGNRPLSALLNALKLHLDIDLSICEYSEHTQGAKAASYVELTRPVTANQTDRSGVLASIPI